MADVPMASRIRNRRYPFELELLSGLRWRGKMCVERPCDDGYLVAFDAESSEGVVYDRTVLTENQVRDWTGVKLGD